MTHDASCRLVLTDWCGSSTADDRRCRGVPLDDTRGLTADLPRTHTNTDGREQMSNSNGIRNKEYKYHRGFGHITRVSRKHRKNAYSSTSRGLVLRIFGTVMASMEATEANQSRFTPKHATKQTLPESCASCLATNLPPYRSGCEDVAGAAVGRPARSGDRSATGTSTPPADLEAAHVPVLVAGDPVRACLRGCRKRSEGGSSSQGQNGVGGGGLAGVGGDETLCVS